MILGGHPGNRFRSKSRICQTRLRELSSFTISLRPGRCDLQIFPLRGRLPGILFRRALPNRSIAESALLHQPLFGRSFELHFTRSDARSECPLQRRATPSLWGSVMVRVSNERRFRTTELRIRWPSGNDETPMKGRFGLSGPAWISNCAIIHV